MSHIHLVTSYRKAKDFSQRFQKSASRYIFTETFRDTPSFEKLEFLRETAENLGFYSMLLNSFYYHPKMIIELVLNEI